MIPETNHDVEISIYLDFLEDQGIIVDRNPEEQDQWHCESKHYYVDGGDGGGRGGAGGAGDGVGDGGDGVGGFFGGVGGGGSSVGGVYDQSKRIGG